MPRSPFHFEFPRTLLQLQVKILVNGKTISDPSSSQHLINHNLTPTRVDFGPLPGVSTEWRLWSVALATTELNTWREIKCLSWFGLVHPSTAYLDARWPMPLLRLIVGATSGEDRDVEEGGKEEQESVVLVREGRSRYQSMRLPL